MARASFNKDFKVAETKGRFAKGPNSPLTLNEKISNASCVQEVFDPMWHLCLVCANTRKLIGKVRGDSNDFLNYATMGYVMRWKKQFEGHDARRPVDKIQNWIPYILNTLRFALISFNKEAYDYDFLPLPRLLEDDEDSTSSSRDLPDTCSKDPLSLLVLESLTSKESLHSILYSLPIELRPFLLDILYYLRTHGMLLSKSSINYVKIGKVLFGQGVDEWMT